MRKIKISQTGLCWLWITILVLAVDRVTKLWIQHHVSAYSVNHITAFFNITLAYNKGAAFSFLNGAAGWQTRMFGALAIGISFVLLVWLSRISRKERWISVALTLIIGGAIGNLWDRISYGHVTDFLQFHISTYYWPVFNIADSSICIGAVMLIFDAFANRKHLE
jgi:signal peptidase II